MAIWIRQAMTSCSPTNVSATLLHLDIGATCIHLKAKEICSDHLRLTACLVSLGRHINVALC